MKEFKDVRDDYDELVNWKSDFIAFSKERGVALRDVYETDLCISFDVWNGIGSNVFYEFDWWGEDYCINDLTNDLLFAKLVEKISN